MPLFLTDFLLLSVIFHNLAVENLERFVTMVAGT